MVKDIFSGLDTKGYMAYCVEHGIHTMEIVNVDLSQIKSIEQKIDKAKWDSVNPENMVPYPVEIDDLIRLHYLVTSRKVRTVMEFGVGKSTHVILDALKKNKMAYAEEVKEKLRCSTPFQLYAIDNNKYWLDKVSEKLNDNPDFFPCHCELIMGTFNDRLCTYYEGLPNVSPDLIYLDGPDQFSVKGDVRGLSTRHANRMPMVADLLAFENFLEPGTLIITDGRGANAQFLKNNFQRNWDYHYFESYDHHIFELVEPALGKWNKAALDFTKA